MEVSFPLDLEPPSAPLVEEKDPKGYIFYGIPATSSLQPLLLNEENILYCACMMWAETKATAAKTVTASCEYGLQKQWNHFKLQASDKALSQIQ